MSFLRARFTAGLRSRDSGTRNTLNEFVYSWSPPVFHPVCGWWSESTEVHPTGAMRSSGAGAGERVNLKVKLITPQDFPAKPHDRVVLDGKLYEIEGWPQDHTSNPFGWNPGNVVWELSRIEGG